MLQKVLTIGHWKSRITDTVDKYEVGDLSGKYGTIGANDALSLVRKLDYNLPLFGENSIVFRSMVIHYNNGSRWVCSNINPKGAEFHFKVNAEFIGPEFNGNITMVSWLKTNGYAYTWFCKLPYAGYL